MQMQSLAYRYAARTEFWFRECECHPARITFLTSSASRFAASVTITLDDQTSSSLVLLPVPSSLKHHRHRRRPLLPLLLFLLEKVTSKVGGLKCPCPSTVGLPWKNLHFEDGREKKSGKKVGACRRAIRCDNVVPVLETDVCERTCLSAGNKILVGAPRRFDGFARANLPRKLDTRFCVSRTRSVVEPLVPRRWCKSPSRVSSIFALLCRFLIRKIFAN